jgi:hypothetical protein
MTDDSFVSNLKWEAVEGEYYAPALYSDGYEDLHPTLERARVFGGWLIRTISGDDDSGSFYSITFIPDPKHEWKIEELPQKRKYI